MCPERMPRGDRRRQRTGSRSARADDGNRNGRRERRSHTRSGCNPVPGRSSAIFIDKRTATEVRVLKRRSRTGTCSKRRPGATTCPRSDLVLHPSHKIAGLESTPGSACAEPPPPAGDTAPTRVLKSGGAIVCRPYGTRGWRDAGVPTTEVVGYFLSSLRDSMRTRRSSCCLSSLTGLNVGTPLISGLTSRRLNFDAFGAGRKTHGASAAGTAPRALSGTWLDDSAQVFEAGFRRPTRARQRLS